MGEEAAVDSDILKAQKLYETEFKSCLEPTHRGKYIAIDVPSKEYFLGSEVLEAYEKASQKYPNRTFVLLRVGYPAARFVGSR